MNFSNMSKRGAFASCVLFACVGMAGEIKTQPWLQNVYTNRFAVMCETKNGPMDGLTLQYGPDYASVAAMTCTNGLKEGTWIYTAQVVTNGAEGAMIDYRLATNGVAISKTEGCVKLWKNEDAAFNCGVWGDNQEGVQEYDWGFGNANKRYQCIRAMFSHMKKLAPDFGFSTGDFSTYALYDEEVEPGELNAADELFGCEIPYHLVWGNHDCNNTNFGQTWTNAAQRYFAPAAAENEGWFHLYRNDVLFIGIHWVMGTDDEDERYDAITNGVARLLATERAQNAKFRIIVQHAPIFLECYNVLPKSDWFSDTRLLDVAKAGNVDLVLSGHTHAYERISRDGIIQVMNGGMGYLDHGERCYMNYGAGTKVGGHQNTPLLWARQDENGELDAAEPVRMGCFQGYGMLSVTNDTLTYTAYAFNANGDCIGVADAFSITSKSSVGAASSPHQDVQPFTPSSLTAPVNNATWAAFKKSQGETWTIPAGTAVTDPVVNVSKTEIERFCAALNADKSTTHYYRLPTLAELTADFEGNLERGVSEWTYDVDPDTGWCRILGGNAKAIDYTWCREYDKPAMATPDCHANYLGFRVVDAPTPSVVASAMDQALAALAQKIAAGEPIAEVYVWEKPTILLPCALVDISEGWTNGTLTTEYEYENPVVFTGKGALAYGVGKDITFGGGVAAPYATSLDFSHKLGNGNKVTVKGEFRGGIAADDWHFYLKCDELTLEDVAYRGQIFNAVTDDRTVNLAGTNDFSGAVMSVGVDSLVSKLLVPGEEFVTNLVAKADSMLKLRRLAFSTHGVAEEVLAELKDTAGFTIGTNVTLVTTDDVLFGIKGAMLTVDGTLESAGVNIAGHLGGHLPQDAKVLGAGSVETTHFGMCDKSALYVGVSNVTLLSAVPYRTYTSCSNVCNVVLLDGASPKVIRERVNRVSTNGIAKVDGLVQAIKAKVAKKGVMTLKGKTVFEDPLTGEFYTSKTDGTSVEVSYTLPDGSKKRFADGTKLKTYAMELMDGTWKLQEPIAAEKDLMTGEPTLRLGVVAQRYPWNGIVDVGYKATFWPRDERGKLEVTVRDVVKTNVFVVGMGNVTGSAKVDLSKIAPETHGKARFKLVESAK